MDLRSGERLHRPDVDAWLPPGPVATSVEDQRYDPGSVLHWCRRLIRFRADLESSVSYSQRMLDTSEGVLRGVSVLMRPPPSISHLGRRQSISQVRSCSHQTRRVRAAHCARR